MSLLTVVVVVLVMFEVYNNLVNLLASLQKVNTARDAESLLVVPFSLLRYSNTQILMARAATARGAADIPWPALN